MLSHAHSSLLLTPIPPELGLPGLVLGRTPQPLAGVPPSTGTWFDGDENPGQGTGKQKESLCLQGRAGKGLDLLPLQRSQSRARAFHLRMISSTQIFLRLGISLNKLQFKTG